MQHVWEVGMTTRRYKGEKDDKDKDYGTKVWMKLTDHVVKEEECSPLYNRK